MIRTNLSLAPTQLAWLREHNPGFRHMDDARERRDASVAENRAMFNRKEAQESAELISTNNKS